MQCFFFLREKKNPFREIFFRVSVREISSLPWKHLKNCPWNKNSVRENFTQISYVKIARSMREKKQKIFGWKDCVHEKKNQTRYYQFTLLILRIVRNIKRSKGKSQKRGQSLESRIWKWLLVTTAPGYLDNQNFLKMFCAKYFTTWKYWKLPFFLKSN